MKQRKILTPPRIIAKKGFAIEGELANLLIEGYNEYCEEVKVVKLYDFLIKVIEFGLPECKKAVELTKKLKTVATEKKGNVVIN